jgi:hypothetical protein
MLFQYGKNEETVEKIVDIGSGSPTRIAIVYPLHTHPVIKPSGDVRLVEINDPEKLPELGEGEAAFVYDVFLHGEIGKLFVSEEGADGSGEQPRLGITFNALPKKKSDSAAKGIVTKNKNTEMAQEICERVESMMDTEVAGEEAKKINMRNAVIVGAAVTILNDIQQRHPKLDFTHLYGSEQLIYQLPDRSGTPAERKVLRQLYDIVYVAAVEKYPDLEKPDKASQALIQRCCHLIYLGEKPKVERAAKAEEAAKAREAKKAEELKEHQALLASMTPEERDKYEEAEAQERARKADAKKERAAARKAALKAQEDANAKAKKEKVVAGSRMFATLMSTDKVPFKCDKDGSYKILINEEDRKTLHGLFEQAVSTHLLPETMVGGFADLVPNIEHPKTITHFKKIQLNACQNMRTAARKGAAVGADDFFDVCMKFFLVRLVGNSWNDTCHTVNTTGVLRVPAVSNDDLAEFMKKSQEEMDTWAKDMEDPELIQVGLSFPLHPDMEAIFEKFSKCVELPFMTEEIVETWKNNENKFKARVVRESVLRSYGQQKSKGKRLNGTADVLSPYGVFDQEESDVKTSRKSMKRAQTVLERAPENTDETKMHSLKRSYDNAFADHKAAVERLEQVKSMGLKDFVDASKVVPEPK